MIPVNDKELSFQANLARMKAERENIARYGVGVYKYTLPNGNIVWKTPQQIFAVRFPRKAAELAKARAAREAAKAAEEVPAETAAEVATPQRFLSREEIEALREKFRKEWERENKAAKRAAKKARKEEMTAKADDDLIPVKYQMLTLYDLNEIAWELTDAEMALLREPKQLKRELRKGFYGSNLKIRSATPNQLRRAAREIIEIRISIRPQPEYKVHECEPIMYGKPECTELIPDRPFITDAWCIKNHYDPMSILAMAEFMDPVDFFLETDMDPNKINVKETVKIKSRSDLVRFMPESEIRGVAPELYTMRGSNGFSKIDKNSDDVDAEETKNGFIYDENDEVTTVFYDGQPMMAVELKDWHSCDFRDLKDLKKYFS